jgi:hypothetical protein
MAATVTSPRKATFCMVGTQAQAHPDLVRKVVAAGHPCWGYYLLIVTA